MWKVRSLFWMVWKAKMMILGMNFCLYKSSSLLWLETKSVYRGGESFVPTPFSVSVFHKEGNIIFSLFLLGCYMNTFFLIDFFYQSNIYTSLFSIYIGKSFNHVQRIITSTWSNNPYFSQIRPWIIDFWVLPLILHVGNKLNFTSSLSSF